jgi:hypothetical protein
MALTQSQDRISLIKKELQEKRAAIVRQIGAAADPTQDRNFTGETTPQQRSCKPTKLNTLSGLPTKI